MPRQSLISRGVRALAVASICTFLVVLMGLMLGLGVDWRWGFVLLLSSGPVGVLVVVVLGALLSGRSPPPPRGRLGARSRRMRRRGHHRVLDRAIHWPGPSDRIA